MWLTRLALRNPILILMLSLMTGVLGWMSLQQLAVDLFPEISIPNIRIAVFHSGAGPEDVEKSITQPLERAVGAAPGIERIESVSKQGSSVITAWFRYGTNLDNAQFEVQQRIGTVLNTLPQGVSQPLIFKYDITNIPVVQLLLTADEMDERQLLDLAVNVIEPQLVRLPGVASASPSGGRAREIQVLAEVDALRARGLSLLDVVGAVRSSNFLLPSGALRTDGRDYNVFTNTQVATPEEVRDVVVSPGRAEGRPVRVRDVARVNDGMADANEIVRVNGQRGVALRVLKQPGSNTIAVVDAVRAAIGDLRGVPATVKLSIALDQSNYIRAAVAALQHEALQGGLFAVLVILVFLLSWRATGIVAVAIPLSVVATFALLYFTGQTLNVFTLGGLALAVGRLVDDSIVELENIHRHLQTGVDRKQAVLTAAQEVAMPILVSTITTIVVFFPVLFLQGVARNLFVPLALTISFALLASFFVSRTVTPLMCLHWLDSGLESGRPQHPLAATIERALGRMDDAYARLLGWVLQRRAVTAGGILGLTIASLLVVFPKVGTEFFPQTDESQFQANLRTPIGTRVDRTEETSAVLERILAQALGWQSDGGSLRTILNSNGLPLGRTGLFTNNTGPHSAQLNVNLVQPRQRPYSDVEAAERVRREIGDQLPGVQVFFNVGGVVKRTINFGSAAPIDVEVLGYDLEAGQVYARQVLEALRQATDHDGRPLLTDLQISREENYPQLDVQVDRQKAGVAGVSQQQIAQTVLATLSGSNQFAPIPFTDPVTGNEYSINVRAADSYRSHVTDLADVPVRTPDGRILSLSSVATIARNSGPVTISRKYLQRVIDVTANVAPDKDLGTAAAAVQRILDDLPPPDGFEVRLGGQAQAQQEAFAGLGLAALLATALVYMVLASQFKSLVDPLVIMFSVPLGISGVFVALWVTGTSLSVNSFMGIIMMIGVVVSNGVLLIDFANVLRRRGKGLHEAIVEAGRTRLRPILMTTIATLVGLAPMALGIGEGSETNLPLARAVIGGLGVSTVLTLVLLPILYTALDRFARRPPPEDFEEAGA